MTSHSTFEDSVAYKQLQRKIKELQKKEYIPQELIRLIDEVSRIQLEIEPEICLASDSAGAAQKNELPDFLPITIASRHAQGEPVLLRENFPVDKSSFPVIAQRIFDVLPSVSEYLHGCGMQLQEAFDNGAYSLEEACMSVVKAPVSLDGNSYFSDWAKKNPEAPHFFSFIATSCVLPSARVAARLLSSFHDSETSWRHGHCPICGSQPLMGRLVQTEGFRMHTCSFCLYEYRAPRMACPFCLSTGEEKASYFASEDEPGYQLHVCHDCKSYCKIADFRNYDRLFMPVLDDLESLVLDMFARKQGFMRPTLSVWGF